MRYQIMVFPELTDARELDLSSYDTLRELATVTDFPSEDQVVKAARKRWPDAAAIVMPLTIGIAETHVIALVNDAHAKVSADTRIECVAIIYAASDTADDRKRIKQKAAFTRELWRMPVTRPELAHSHRIELRATDLEVPSFTEARVGTYEGRLVIYAELGGIELSIRFEDPRVQLVVSGAPDRVPPDGRDVSGELDRIAGV